MAKTEVVRARVETELKEQAEKILTEEGFTMSSAISMMLRQVVYQGKLPFPIEGSFKLNARSQAVADAMDRGEMPTQRFANSAELFKSLGIADQPAKPEA